MARTKTDTAEQSTDAGFVFEEVQGDMASTRGKRSRENIFTAPMRATYESGQAKQVRVQNEDVESVKSEIHRAARELNLGVDAPVVDNGDGTSYVQFRARERRQHRS